MNACNEKNYNKIKELFDKGFQTSMSEFSPAKQSFYSSRGNHNSQDAQRNGSSASNGFKKGGNKPPTPRKFGSSTSVSAFKPNNEATTHTKRASIRSNRDYGSTDNIHAVTNKTISGANSSSKKRIQKILPDSAANKIMTSESGKRNSNYTDTEDSKTMKSTPNRFNKQRRIQRRNIKKLDEKSVPRGPMVARKPEGETTPLLDESDVFSRLKDPDSKVSSKAAEFLLSNYQDHLADIPANLSTIFNSQASLF